MNVKLYLDLDGVFADLDGHFHSLTGKHPREVPRKEFWKVLTRTENFFRNLPMYPDATRLWEACKPHNPIFLSGIASVKDCKIHKEQWVVEKFGHEWQTIVLPKAEKQNYAHKSAILIDDNKINIDQWKAKGGLGILHDSSTVDFTISLLNRYIKQVALK